MPLSGTYKSSTTEPPPLGLLAIAMNGVAIYGAQEGGGTNAADPEAGAQITDAQYCMLPDNLYFSCYMII